VSECQKEAGDERLWVCFSWLGPCCLMVGLGFGSFRDFDVQISRALC